MYCVMFGVHYFPNIFQPIFGTSLISTDCKSLESKPDILGSNIQSNIFTSVKCAHDVTNFK